MAYFFFCKAISSINKLIDLCIIRVLNKVRKFGNGKLNKRLDI